MYDYTVIISFQALFCPFYQCNLYLNDFKCRFSKKQPPKHRDLQSCLQVLVIDMFKPAGVIELLFKERVADSAGISDMSYDWIDDTLFYVINGTTFPMKCAPF